MTLQDRIEDGMNETRTLLLGAQVFAGFAFSSCFASRFDSLPTRALHAQALAITVLTAALAWLMFPGAYHQVAQRGHSRLIVCKHTTTVLDYSLLPLAIGLGLCVHPAAVALALPHPTLFAISTVVVATISFYGIGLISRGPSNPKPKVDSTPSEKLEERIKNVLMECRMVLPGAQAFLGFLFANVFTESFSKLPRSSQLIHAAGMALVMLSTILLLTPAAYHRLATRGNPSEKVHTVGSLCLLAALTVLAPGMACELFVVLRKLTRHTTLSAITALVFIALSYALWFAYSALSRKRR